VCLQLKEFKACVERFAPQFVGQAQQDAQEFMACLLDGLHEDINRASPKDRHNASDAGSGDSLSLSLSLHARVRAIRSDSLECALDREPADPSAVAQREWAAHKARHDSRVVDLFHGQLDSSLKCRQCGRESHRFEPFVFLSLPVPSKYQRHVTSAAAAMSCD
jgi:ubiquitin carboxyl-terminal hydrolase 4/11/15